MTIQQGDTVRWINTSTSYHTSTSGTGCSPDGLWNSGLLAPGQEFRLPFNTTGTFPYFCIPHCSIGMVGTITVNPSSDIEEVTNKPWEKIDLKVNPVVSGDKIDIELYITMSGNARLEVLDYQGRLVTVLYAGHINSGKHKMVYPNSIFHGKGVYFIRLVTDIGSKLVKTIVMH